MVNIYKFNIMKNLNEQIERINMLSDYQVGVIISEQVKKTSEQWEELYNKGITEVGDEYNVIGKGISPNQSMVRKISISDAKNKLTQKLGNNLTIGNFNEIGGQQFSDGKGGFIQYMEFKVKKSDVRSSQQVTQVQEPNKTKSIQNVMDDL